MESRLLSNAGGWSGVTLSQLAKLESVRSRVLRQILASFKGEEMSVSDERIRMEARVPPGHVLIMARRLQLAARGATPALFALLQRYPRISAACADTMSDKLGTMPHPPVEPEAWERLWKA